MMRFARKGAMAMVRLSKTALLLLAGLVAGAALALHYSNDAPRAQQAGTLAAPEGLDRTAPTSNQQVMLSYAPVVERASPAVVNIYTAKVVRQRRNAMLSDPLLQFFFGNPSGLSRDRVERSLGSGVLVSPDGLIVTNRHVVGDADQIRVVLADRREFEAKLILSDERSDLALIRINAGAEKLPVLPLGDSDLVKVGDLVLAIGNPFGVGQTVTHGIVSALRSGGEGPTGYQYYIQTDAAINPGNSGGALVGMDGRLIGLNTFIYSQSGGSVGIGFAVPVSLVRSVIAAAGTGKVVRPWIGLETQAIDSELAQTLELQKPMGVLVNRVSSGSPAARAGLEAGDIVLAINDVPVTDPEALRFQIATRQPGQSLRLQVMHKGKVAQVSVTAVAPPETPPRDVTVLGGRTPFTGLKVANLSPALAQELAVPQERGVIVLEVSGQSLAARLGMVRPGDILETVGGTSVDTVKELDQAARASGDGIRFSLLRGGQRGACVIQPPNQAYCR